MTDNSKVVKITDSTPLAPVSPVDPLEAYANAVAPQFIIGEMLRFSKGDWLVGDATIPVGTQFTANPAELMAGWIKWQNNKPVEHIMVRVDDGVPPKLRHELGDDDQAQWEVDKNGKPRDPWQFTNYLPLMDEEGELYTFTTSSRGGIGVIADLARRFARHRKRHPDVLPVIKLNVDSYQHKDPQLGRIKVPVFEPAGYLPRGDFLAALTGAGVDSGGAAAVLGADEGGEAEEDKLNDEIPF